MKAATLEHGNMNQVLQISIHAAREGGDRPVHTAGGIVLISIHAAREGGDPQNANAGNRLVKFQSTPPVKAATILPKTYPSTSGFQSTPPVKAATYTH